MGRKAITLEEQIKLLQERGMQITDEEKAKEVLLDVGYYRLGFYWFPFEKNYPNKKNRDHIFNTNASFDDVVRLYYFDFKLRNTLLKYLIRIEVNFRTCLTYYTSNLYPNSPTWFVDPQVVSKKQISGFDSVVYTPKFKKNKVIALHHRKYINDKYAPAWKTLEFMTLGNIVSLYNSLNNQELKQTIATQFNIKSKEVFENYINLILDIRNACAHGNILFDFTPQKSIRKGPAMMKNVAHNQNLNGALMIVLYMVKQVSQNRYNDLIKELNELIAEYTKKSASIEYVIKNISGITGNFV
ncbi:MAG: Abi family protein [Paludibacteraceae bacterium]|nr:Abi family protein [Paludibacteraceae bacterium]